MLIYELDRHVQRHPEDADVNVSQVLNWKLLKQPGRPSTEPDLILHYGGDSWMFDTRHTDFERVRVEQAVRELKRITAASVW